MMQVGIHRHCGYVGSRGGRCRSKVYLGGDFCWTHSERVRRGAKLFCRYCNEVVNRS